MFRKFIVILVAVVATTLLAGKASAQTAEQGRPDPTGQGRYTQYGTEKPYEAARVLKTLPEGAPECAPAGELVGVELLNSTREGKAILSKLTDKATVSTVDGRIFLCKCAAGYNELFLIKSEETTKPSATTTEVPAATTSVATAAAPTQAAPATQVAVTNTDNTQCAFDNTALVDPSAGWTPMAYDKKIPVASRTVVAQRACGGNIQTVTDFKATKEWKKFEIERKKIEAEVLKKQAEEARKAAREFAKASTPCSGGFLNMNQYAPGCNGYPPLQQNGSVGGTAGYGYGSPVYSREGQNYVANATVGVQNSTPNGNGGNNYVGVVPTTTTNTPTARAPQNIVGSSQVQVLTTGTTITTGGNYVYRTGGGQ